MGLGGRFVAAVLPSRGQPANAAELRSRLRWRWTGALIVGELIGFVPPAVAGAMLVAADVGEFTLVAGLVLAGSVEGAVLGWTTSVVLAQHVPGVDTRAWIRNTALGASVAWLAGMGGSALVQAAGPVAWIVVGPGFAIGLVSMGALQWLVLRTVLTGAWRWIPVTSVAWLMGVMIPVTALSIIPNQWPLAIHVLVGVFAAVAMGATVGLLTGHTLEVLVGTD